VRAVRRFGYPGGQARSRKLVNPFAETHPRLWLPVAWDHGLRLWLKSAASSRLCRSCCFWWAKAFGGETKISYRPFCPSSGDHYPRTKSEDDAVGAPRLVLRRWGQDLMRRSATPRRQSAKPQWDVGVGPRSASVGIRELDPRAWR